MHSSDGAWVILPLVVGLLSCLSDESLPSGCDLVMGGDSLRGIARYLNVYKKAAVE